MQPVVQGRDMEPDSAKRDILRENGLGPILVSTEHFTESIPYLRLQVVC